MRHKRYKWNPQASILFTLFLVLSCLHNPLEATPSMSDDTDDALATSDTPVVASQNDLILPPIVVDKGAMAVNLEHFKDNNAMVPFVDVAHQAGGWIPQLVNDYVWDTGAYLHQDGLGNILSLAPGQAAGKQIFNDMTGAYPSGEYTFVHEGEGTFEFHLAASLINKTTVGSKTVYKVAVDNTVARIHLKLVATNPNNPVRNLQFILPGYDYTNHPTFNPLYLNVLQSFNTLRFLDWGNTNFNHEVQWSERTTTEASTQVVEGGVAYEYMVELCNELKANLWINVPYKVDDNYIYKLAELLRDSVDAQRLIYVEYSNEVWNGIFAAAQYALDQGLNVHQLSSNGFEAQLRFYSMRATQVMTIFEQVFAGQMHRLRRVYASQSATPFTAQTILDFQNAASHADALAIAPYFGNAYGKPETQSVVETMTVDEIINELPLLVEKTMANVVANKAIADAKNIKLIAYESGQHLAAEGPASQNSKLVKLLYDVNKHPFMKTLYLYYILRWMESGGELMAMYHLQAWPSAFSNFGLLEKLYFNNGPEPKWQAVHFVNQHFGPWFTF